jgi:ABC-type antimicrobial peptide transport system permease subunit
MLGMQTLESVAAEGTLETVLTQGESSIPVVAQMVSGNYFSVLGVSAEQGRTLAPSDDRPGGGEIPVVVSHRLFQQQFGNSAFRPSQSLYLQGVPFSIVGVMLERFYGTSLDSSPDLWLPTSAQPLLSNKALTDANSDIFFSIVARLQSGTTMAQAQAEFGNLFHAFQKQSGDDDPKRTGILTPIEQGSFRLRQEFGHALNLMLWGLVLLLLLICASVAGVLLVRQLRRDRDQAVRLALGATRVRLLLESLREATALGLSGAIGGVLVAWIFAPLLRRLLPAALTPLPISLTPDFRTDLVIVVLALLLSISFGVLPAWRGSKANPQEVLRSGSATRKSGMVSRVILIAQIAGSLVLLVGTGLLLHTLHILRHTNPGFDVEHLTVFAVNPGIHERSAQMFWLPGS